MVTESRQVPYPLVGELPNLMSKHYYLYRVKLWQLLLAIYVLVLSGLPCEAYCVDDDAPSAISQASVPVSGDHAHDESCSPFCLCATCLGFTIPQPPQFTAMILLGVIAAVSSLPRYQAPHTSDVQGRIWQPPRLS